MIVVDIAPTAVEIVIVSIDTIQRLLCLRNNSSFTVTIFCV